MISLPSKPKIIEKKDNKAIFEIEALYPGYGATIGNSLRRVLFSSLPGAAITQVKIKGALHEFSTIPGILEDVMNIMLNLKQLRFKIFSDEPQQAQLKIKGKKEIKASDFKLPSQVELINKDAHIATVTNPKTELEMEITIEKGLGYSPAEQRKKEKLDLGMVALDAFFTPIKRVNYKISNMRVGDRTDFDKLSIEVETDGSITPEEAFIQASDILVEHFVFIHDDLEKDMKKENKKPKTAQKKTKASFSAKEEDIKKMLVEECAFSARTVNSLIKGGIKTLGGLVSKSEEQISGLEGMGGKGVKEIKQKIKKYKLELK